VLSLPKLRQCTRVLENGHANKVASKLSAGPNFGTSGIEESYLVYISTDLAADVRNLPGFTPVVEYGQQKSVHAREIGAVEEFRFLTSPYFRPFSQAGANATAGTVLSAGVACTGSNATDVYPIIVMGASAWGNVALKGQGATQPIYLPARQITHANPSGQFGYVGANFWKTAVRLAEPWMIRLEVGASAL
jgi:N4-gp56 family major capsid protein